ncbi:MAG: hypothetical protein VKN72_09135 [Nostocales cyanobacterium 94392]|nr:hypothetical protein [Nostocales cyanobacterium 94392]
MEQVIEKSNLSALTGTNEDAGNITINTGRLFVKDGGEITANTLDEGRGGNISIQVDSAFLDNNASINSSSGIEQITPERKFGGGGNISINARDNLTATNSTISTISKQSSGGAINITAGDIRLFGDSDIATNVFSGEGGGGNINLTANTIIAFDDSDILSFASDGKGGDIQFNTAGFFSEALYRQTSTTDANALTLLDGNNRTDLNASGAVSGAITGVPVTFIDEELTDLPENQIDTNALIANSCIARGTKRQENSFKITGSGGLRNSPGDGFISEYSIGDVRNVESNSQVWKKGDAIVEPQGLYQLPDGRLLLSRSC